MLTGYTDWHGNHVFFDTKLDVGYGDLDGQRSMIIGTVDRVAEGKRASLLGALGGTTGLFMNYAGIDLIPHISLDGMSCARKAILRGTGGGRCSRQPHQGTGLAAGFHRRHGAGQPGTASHSVAVEGLQPHFAALLGAG